MEFPDGNPRHHRHQGTDDNEEYPPPSRPYRHSSNDEPPPPTREDHDYAPPPEDYRYAAPPPRPSREDHDYAPPPEDYGYAPPPRRPSREEDHDYAEPNKRSVRVYSKAEPNYSLTIRDGGVILARSNPSDPYQHWIKDERYSTKVKDDEGFPSFALVNKETGEALKHSIGASHPVQLIPYKPDYLDEAILWTESIDLGDTYRTIRMVNNISLNVDALNADQDHGGVHDGTTIVLWEWTEGDNQRWKIIPY